MKTKILIAGGSGLIGHRLTQYLSLNKYHFNILSRSSKKDTNNISYFLWDTQKRTLDPKALQDVAIVINLAGAGIADKRWTPARKKLLLESRLHSTYTLEQAIKALPSKPALYIGASAVGYYGNQGSTIMTEDDNRGSGFLADVTAKWEDAHQRVMPLCKRATLLRIGIVLSKNGGALKEILKPATAGIYGYFGNGEAYYSWIHIDDICRIIETHIREDKYSGTYNATAPEPITIKQLVTAVKKAKGGLGLVMPVPTLALRLAMGEMVQMLTDSMRVEPKRLLEQGFEFKMADPVEALKHILAEKC